MASSSIYTNPRMLAVLFLGFSSGLPLNLTDNTLQAWMTAEKVDLSVIGAFSLVHFPYTWKFVWSPLMDRFTIPILGRRRGWILVCQVVLMAAIAGMGMWSPDGGLWLLVVLAFVVSFCSATQDIAIDAYRTEVLKPAELGPGASSYTLGYRFGMILALSGALRLSMTLSWRSVYWIMGGFMLLGVLATLMAPEPEVEAAPPQSIEDAVTLPFYQFFKRPGAVEMVAFILLYKLDGVLVNKMTTPFLLQIGFQRSEVGDVTGYQGLLATMVGLVLAAVVMPRLGLYVSLWTFGLMQGVSNLAYYWMAITPPSYAKLVTVVVLDQVATGLGVAALGAFMMSLCDPRYTATQFALLSSSMALTRVIGGTPSGYLAQGLGWPLYFLFCTVIAVPGLLLLTRYHTWTSREAVDLTRPIALD